MEFKKEVEFAKNHVLSNMIHKVEFSLKDLLQVITGASILSVPVGFTEETWKMGTYLPWLNVLILMGISLLFIGAFVYYFYHAEKLKFHANSFMLRLFATYIFSFLVVAVILTLIQAAPWATEWAVALKRTIVVAFPASMSAAVADTFK